MTRTSHNLEALQSSLRESQARYHSVIAAMAEGVVIIGKDGRVIECNEAAQVILDRGLDGIVGRRGSVISRRAIKEGNVRFRASECPIVIALRGSACTGLVMGITSRQGRRWLSINTRPIFDDDGQTVHTVVASFNDITDRRDAEDALKRSQEKLYFLATHDGLTNLPNRSLLHARINHATALAQRTAMQVAILFIDLDRFKSINDNLGHTAGDTLLKAIADRLRECVRQSDTVARQGGDEFIVVMENVQDVDEIKQAVERMQAALAKPLVISAQEVYMTASIGVSVFPKDAEDSDTLVRHADVAMYRAKQGGRNCVQFYDAAHDTHSLQRFSLENRLRRAVDHKEFVLHYQPRLCLRSGNICAMEALIRWQTPEGHLILPDEFIPIAEETGLNIPVGQWALEEACRQNKRWQDEGLGFMPVSVNLSTKQFADDDLAARISAALAAAAIDARWLELEITESAAMSDLWSSSQTLKALQGLGVRVTLDDFGTGYSSLSYLRRFPIHALKIDRSFITSTPADQDAVAIVGAIAALAQSLRLETVGEGTESLSQLELLHNFGYTEAQGNYISAPMPAAEIPSFMNAPPLQWPGGDLFSR